MNKKFITLCVSALLAGGMVTPSYAALNLKVDATQVTFEAASAETNLQYYVIKFHDDGEPGMSDWCLKGNFDGYTLTDAQPTQLDGYSLWRITAHKNANGVVDGYQFVNAYGIPLALNPDKKELDKAIEEAEKHLKSEDKDELEKAGKELSEKMQSIGAKLYQAAAEEAKKSEGDKSDDKSSGDDAVEGEVIDKK